MKLDFVIFSQTAVLTIDEHGWNWKNNFPHEKWENEKFKTIWGNKLKIYRHPLNVENWK